MKKYSVICFSVFLVLFSNCKKEVEKPAEQDCVNTEFFKAYSSRNFKMGFSTWAYAPTVQSVNDTYQFIESNSDIYSEHIDYKIPWKSWINNLPLPVEFTNEINSRVSRRLSSTQLTLSVSLLNNERTDLAEDFDGTIPVYNTLNDTVIENAYVKHIQYLVQQFSPDYLVIAIEVNELKIKSPSKWDGYKLLMKNVKARILQEFPSLRISESITLHNLFQPEVANPENYISEMVSYANAMDFVAISFYPYFKGLHSKSDFQEVFDFLHQKITRPIAFAETAHLPVNLTISSFYLDIKSTECEQNAYVESLLTNAQQQDYEYVIWWAHRDFYELWLTFPDESKDLGKVWRNTGLLTDDGTQRKAFATWQMAF